MGRRRVIIPSGGSNSIADGRLTLVSGTPEMTTAQSAKTTLYYTPAIGNRISLFNGDTWSVYSFSELSLSLSGLTANTNYDCFIYDNNGTLTLELVAWTNGTTRATALVSQDGVLSKSGTLQRRYLGTIRTTGSTGQCEYSFGGTAAGGTEAKLFVWNYNNRRPVSTFVADSTDNWTYASTTWRAANNSSTMRTTFVVGVDTDIDAEYIGIIGANTGEQGSVAIGLNATNAPASRSAYQYVFESGATTIVGPAKAQYSGFVSAGLNFVSALEQVAAGTVAFIGDDALSYVQTALCTRLQM